MTDNCSGCGLGIGPANHGVTLYRHEPEYETTVFCETCRKENLNWIAQGWPRVGARTDE
jgi:hypothetical protein